MLNQLPDNFKEETGGGCSFLNACNNNKDEQWTGEHRRMEQLFTMGLGIGKVSCPLPKEMWQLVSGGMPYYMIKK
jgi:predicted nucleic acid binding AN1-type Zn finger protein